MPRSGEAAPPSRSGASRLADAGSAYLRSAKLQPIDWHPWGEEPFQLAQRLNRPILLDVGAVWCHWCHVMDEGTYEDVEVARLLQQNFVAVKVDRDEHPEVDRRYQRQVSALTGQGGWPLTAFLTPKGEVFLGGTYFPPQDAMGRPGFRRVLKEVARLWKEEPAKAQQNAESIQQALARAEGHTHAASPRPPSAFLASILSQHLQSYDVENGGFGLAPKFPHPTGIAFLLFAGLVTEDESTSARARETLLRMADGGMYDQLGGGFHRYSVDEAWHIPHFEKMGADNAALLGVYVDGARRFGDPRLVETVRGIAGWTQQVLADPKGGFGASQDADNAPGDDGGYFTWSRPELKAALDSEELRLVARYFGVGSDGRMPHDAERNVLFRLMPLAEAAEGIGIPEAKAAATLSKALEKLRAVRGERPTPTVDTALYADINGSFIASFVKAGRLLREPMLIASARAAADRFLSNAYEPDRGVAHLLAADGGRGFGHLQDQGEFALGLVELAGATLEPRYVKVAEQILDVVGREYPGAGGVLRDIAPGLYDGPSIASVGEASYPVEDNPNLSANAAVALAEIRLASLTNSERRRERAQTLVTALQPRVEGAGLFGAGTALAAGLLDLPFARVVVEGKGPVAESLRRAAESSWHPNLWVFEGVPPVPFSLPEEVTAQAGGKESRALVCFGTRCLAPVTDPELLPGLLHSSGRAAG